MRPSSAQRLLHPNIILFLLLATQIMAAEPIKDCAACQCKLERLQAVARIIRDARTSREAASRLSLMSVNQDRALAGRACNVALYSSLARPSRCSLLALLAFVPLTKPAHQHQLTHASCISACMAPDSSSSIAQSQYAGSRPMCLVMAFPTSESTQLSSQDPQS